MSTTNPPAGPNNPGGDQPRPVGGPQPGAGPQWPRDAAHGDAPDDHGGGGGVNPASLRAGHEPDTFYVKPILSIPLAVVVTFVIAFAVAAAVYAYFATNRPDPLENPMAAERGKVPLNERLTRIDRAGQDKDRRPEVDQPRLEPLRRLENEGKMLAQPPLPAGNSPELHPEDVRAGRAAELQKAGWVDKDKVARIPIEDAMKAAAHKKDFFPVQKDAKRPGGTDVRPSASNGGQPGVEPGKPAKKDDHDHGHDDHKDHKHDTPPKK